MMRFVKNRIEAMVEFLSLFYISYSFYEIHHFKTPSCLKGQKIKITSQFIDPNQFFTL